MVAIERMGKHNGGKGGSIINTASIFGLSPSTGFPIYCATKYGVVGFTLSLKVENPSENASNTLRLLPTKNNAILWISMM